MRSALVSAGRAWTRRGDPVELGGIGKAGIATGPIAFKRNGMQAVILTIGLSPLAICLIVISRAFIQSIWARVQVRRESFDEPTHKSKGFIASHWARPCDLGETADDPIYSARASSLRQEVWTRIDDVQDGGPPHLLPLPLAPESPQVPVDDRIDPPVLPEMVPDIGRIASPARHDRPGRGSRRSRSDTAGTDRGNGRSTTRRPGRFVGRGQA
jgi:hypothetical protein